MAGDGGLVVLCPGQGAQAVGMGATWAEASSAARGVLAAADEVVARTTAEMNVTAGPLAERSLSSIMSEGPAEDLNRTDVSQPAIFAASMMSLAGEAERRGVGIDALPMVAAGGLSLGEYTALCAAGAISLEDGLRLVTIRGRAMQDAAEAVPSGMVALIGADEAKAGEVCEAALVKAGEGAVLVAANFNAPGQVVVSGSAEACDAAEAAAGEMDLRAARLPVAGAFHSPIMGPAAERLGAALAATEIAGPRCPVMSNAAGAAHAGGESAGESIEARLVEQLTSPVRWEANCRDLIGMTGEGDGFVELAPGKTLAGLMRRIERGVKVATWDAPA